MREEICRRQIDLLSNDGLKEKYPNGVRGNYIFPGESKIISIKSKRIEEMGS